MAGIAAQRSTMLASRPNLAAAACVRVGAKPARLTTVKTQALFGFGGSKPAADAKGAVSKYYICIDCGFIYDGDFSKVPGSYKCPACSSPKSRFKMYKGAVSGKVNNTGGAMKKRMAEKSW